MRRSWAVGLLVWMSMPPFVLALRPAGASGDDAPAKAEPRKTEEKENYDDGTLHFRVPLDAKGQRHGQYTAYFPGGKHLQERAHYEHGAQAGTREVYDEKGRLLSEELWGRGKLIFPKSIRMIESQRSVLTKEAAAAAAKLPKGGNAHAPKADVLARAVARANTYRYLCDVPADVVLDNDHINLCQYASELLVKVGHLTHTPDRPAGFDEKAYELGRDGCGRSNLYQASNGGDPVASIDGYMNDSDAGNIDRLGHRRWVLNPRMGKTGFGSAGQFTAMYSFDNSREDVPAYDFVCFPPRGLCPTNLFGAGWAWHASVNPAKYSLTEKAELAIYPVDARFQRSSHPLELDYQHVDRGGFGINNAIIARPKPAGLRNGATYEVLIKGVEDQDGKPADLSYFVSFYAAPGATR